jgi:diguanylate cyclase (GGDEF)-like protein/PAS domain S-box-containing protein
MSVGQERSGSSGADWTPGSSVLPAAADLRAVGMIVAGPDGAATYANRAWGALTGQAEGDWPGQGWLDVIVEPDRAAQRAALLAVLASGEMYRADWNVQRSDLVTRILHITAAPQLAGDRLTGLVATLADVTDTRARAESVSERRTHDPLTGLYNRAHFLDRVAHVVDRRFREPERLAAVLSIDVDALRATNDRLGHVAGDRLLRATAAWITAVVRSTDVVARYGGNEFCVLLDDMTDAAAAELVAERIRSVSPDSAVAGGPISLNVGLTLVDDEHSGPGMIVDRADRARRRDKRTTPVPHARIAPNGSRTRHRVGLTHDVENVLALAAHELLNPLTAVLGYATLLRDNRAGMSDTDLDTAFAVLERQCSGLARLLEDLLELGSRHNGMTPDAAPVALDVVVADALKIAPPPEGRIVTTEGNWPAVSVSAERTSLARVVVNLLINAYRYGGPIITVTSKQVAQDVLLSVDDDGSGVPEDLVATLFQPFTKGRNTSANGSTGRGLGLALARETVGSIGGRLEYTPRQPHGACFVVTLPIDRPRRAS